MSCRFLVVNMRLIPMAFALEEVPKEMIVLGAGYIAAELSGMSQQFGSHVSGLIVKNVHYGRLIIC